MRTGILDYLRKVSLGPPGHLNIRNPIHLNIRQLHINIRTGISYYLQGPAVWPALHIFKCRYRILIGMFNEHQLYMGILNMCIWINSQ